LLVVLSMCSLCQTGNPNGIEEFFSLCSEIPSIFSGPKLMGDTKSIGKTLAELQLKIRYNSHVFY